MRLLLASAALGLLTACAVLALGGCYDTTKPAPPCTVNSPNPGCPDWPHDQRRPDGGR